ncbi:Macrolide-specific efflux protein macA precursor [[Eubacterium] contortum]|uniref:Macrolide-specific efflux protein macA n=1 Tax=Faecalicatena contorta TaxID=39482 RepID=A0A174I4A6_9FIRM|nr:efflux RND transporter periplasmic adaptor subunit [Faecalicatena contorta]CUO80218.1 Macrolide-specific efflux protein macA precursor [[Eubacterium] contortum] [Faecalicatena contorta]
MFSKKKKEQEEILDTIDNDLTDEDLLSGDDSYELEDAEAAKPPKKKLPAWIIIPVIAVLGIVIFAASKLTTGSGSNQATTLQVAEVTTGDIKEVYNASGKIESENTKTYYSPVTAPVAICNAVVGNSVKAGDLLVSFDTTNLERDNQQAQLSLQSSLNASQATKAQNAKAIDAANAASAQAADQANRLADKVNDLAAQVDAAYAQYQANQAEADAAAPEQERLKKIVAEQQEIINTNQAVIDEINTNYAGRRADLEAALAKPDDQRTADDTAVIKALQPIFKKYDDAAQAINDAQQIIDETAPGINNDPVNDAGYAQLKAQYDAAYAEWEAAYNAANAPATDPGMSSAELANLDISDNLAELTALTPAELVEKGREGMKADMDGVIAAVDALQTNTATQGMAMFTIASTEKVRVKIEVSPDDYEKMKVGNKATVTVGDYKYEGKLTKVNKIAVNNEKGNPVIGAEIHIDNPDENLCIGATAKITMTVAEADNVLVVPTEVINTSSEGDFVYVIENGVVKKKPVELGTASTTQIEVKSGLKKGDKVVNDLNVDIEDGMKATAAPAKGTGSDAGAEAAKE